MNRSELDQQADRLEMFLQDHQTPARVTGGNVTPRWIQFLLQPAPGIKVNKVEALSREIAIALGATTARVKAEGGAVKVEVLRSDPSPVSLMRMMTRLPANRVPMGAAVLGLADDGAPLLVRLPSPDVAHVLVAGTPGSGKTALLQTMIISLALLHHRRQMQFVLIACPAGSGIDPQGHAFESLADLPHLLRPIVTRPDQAISALADVVKLMGARDQTHTSEPHIAVVIDDLAGLIQSGGPAVAVNLEMLLMNGREAGIHVVVATDRPSSPVLSPIVTANFPVRIVGRMTSAEDARVAAGISGTNAEKLTGHGDFIAITGPGTIRFQAAYISIGDTIDVVQSLKRGIAGATVIETVRDNWYAHKRESGEPLDPHAALEAQVRNLPPAANHHATYGPDLN